MNSSNSRRTSLTRTPRLLLGLAADGVLGILAALVEQPGGRLQQHAVGVAVEEDRQAELASQQHGAGLRVVEQDRHPVAAVVRLADLVRRSRPSRWRKSNVALRSTYQWSDRTSELEVRDPVVVPEVDAVAAADAAGP